jgi:hypothetical protein
MECSTAPTAYLHSDLVLGEGCSHVLGCLYPVGFPHLRMLQLRYAGVTSIEGVSRMNLPSLEVLFLSMMLLTKPPTKLPKPEL